MAEFQADEQYQIALHAAGEFDTLFGNGRLAPITSVAEQQEARQLEYQEALDVEAVNILPLTQEYSRLHMISQEDMDLSRSNCAWAQTLYDEGSSKVTPHQLGVHRVGAHHACIASNFDLDC